MKYVRLDADFCFSPFWADFCSSPFWNTIGNYASEDIIPDPNDPLRLDCEAWRDEWERCENVQFDEDIQSMHEGREPVSTYPIGWEAEMETRRLALVERLKIALPDWTVE